MSFYRHALPQRHGSPFLTDGGLGTSLHFLEGVELPFFAAFPLLADEKGRRMLRSYFELYLRMAVDRDVGFILDTVTWRANADWGEKLGHSKEELANINGASVAFASKLREDFASNGTQIVINGVIGPRGDGYGVNSIMTTEGARSYHSVQIETFRNAGADMVTASTFNYVEEAIGLAEAARASGMPVVISFTVETNGKLPSGQTLRSAIEQMDQVTESTPAYYMINCTHPCHFDSAISESGPWLERIRGVRANASMKTHAELDAAQELRVHCSTPPCVPP